jgi:large subunit ribosomal protein L24
MKIRRNDIVVVLRGRDQGKQGKVLQVQVDQRRVTVEGVNLVTKHVRKSQENPAGGTIKKEAPLAVANLKLFCAQCKKGVQVTRVLDGKKRVRKCKGCGQTFDS